MAIKLNEEQLIAAEHVHGPCMVISVPGSGKTGVLTERTVRLVEKGIDSSNIINLTFTNKAAKEMRERITNRLQGQFNGYTGTFHALCAAILRKFGFRIGYDKSFSILDSNDQTSTLKKVARGLGDKIDASEAAMIAKVYNDHREKLLPIDELREVFDLEFHYNVALGYRNRIFSENCIDFSGLLCETIRLLHEHEDIKGFLQKKFKYIQVDEVQDTNFAQFHLLKQMYEQHGNIMMVGDISQSIYKFRGARYQNITDFLSQNKDCKVVALSKNYRSTPEIIKHAEKLIKYNASHQSEKFEPIQPSGHPVVLREFKHQYDESNYVAGVVEALVENGWSPKDIAVLYRVNSMAEPIRMEMARRNVPHVVVGGYDFYDRKEIKDVISMIKLHSNRRDSSALSRVLDMHSGMVTSLYL